MDDYLARTVCVPQEDGEPMNVSEEMRFRVREAIAEEIRGKELSQILESATDGALKALLPELKRLRDAERESARAASNYLRQLNYLQHELNASRRDDMTFDQLQAHIPDDFQI